MRVPNLHLLAGVGCCCLSLVMSAEEEPRGEQLTPEMSDDQGSARILTTFLLPFLPVYQDIDWGENLNSLKSANSASYFITRDTMTFMALILTHLTAHRVFWAGKLSREEDVPLPIRIISKIMNPFKSDQISRSDDDPYVTKFDTLEEKVIRPESFPETSLNGVYNSFADPNPSFRNIIMGTGFVTFQLILWFLPTLIWDGEKRPVPPVSREGYGSDHIYAEDRLGNLLTNIEEAEPVAIYNRLLSPQGVVTNICILILGYTGKLLFWWFITSLDDFKSFRVKPILGRSFPEQMQEQKQKTWTALDLVADVADGYMAAAEFDLAAYKALYSGAYRKLN